VDIGKIGSNSIIDITSSTQRSVTQASDESFEQKLNAAVASRDEEQLKKACQEFEHIMLDMMYKQMKATIIRSNLVQKDAGSEIYESMLDEKLMEAASRTGSFGLAEMLYKQLSRNFETKGVNADEGEPVHGEIGEKYRK
jgi:flagellar protein FlgJ